MSLIIKFFVASDDEAAAAVVDRGPDEAFESLVFGNFDIEEAMIEWESILTGRSFEELVEADEPAVVADPSDGEGPMVLAASKALQDALAAADLPRLVEVSELWVQERAAKGEVFDREVATKILGDLAGLARSVGGRGSSLYCWVA
ncbi:hypothetical protein [Streptomyces sp. NRRL WC-3742]|uniref:hypothetical protein n=1 Tax=Streptomyces sp. NRRL WC-3742 TaxID=1463934 RepID=UPI0004CB24EF|nr:hypothetical protein [Streptomyces sp. NRRL WC-3742]